MLWWFLHQAAVVVCDPPKHATPMPSGGLIQDREGFCLRDLSSGRHVALGHLQGKPGRRSAALNAAFIAGGIGPSGNKRLPQEVKAEEAQHLVPSKKDSKLGVAPIEVHVTLTDQPIDQLVEDVGRLLRRADVSQPFGMHDRDTGLGDACFR